SEQRAELSSGAEQVDPDSRLVKADHRADFARRAVAVVTQHEHGALPSFETVDGGGHARPPLTREEARFRVTRAGAHRSGRKDRAIVGQRRGAGGVVGGHEPAVATDPRLTSIEAAVDENSCKPDFKRPRLTIRTDMTEDLDERVLDGLVGFGGVAQILK